MSDKNTFFKYNHPVISKSESGLIINYPDLVLSNGSLKGIQVVSAKNSQGYFSLNWKIHFDLTED